MTTNARTAILAIGCLLLTAASIWSHHSQAMYDTTKEITIAGVIAEFTWRNPHSWIYVDAAEDGATVRWDFETVSPNSMTRAGWKRDTLKVGDKVSLVGNPHKDGKKKVARLVRVLLPDGRVLLPGRDPAYPAKEGFEP